MNTTPRARLVYVWLPHWPIDRLARARRTPAAKTAGSAKTAGPPAEAEAFALVEAGPKGLRVAAADAAARGQAVFAGLALADARARCAVLRTEPIDRDADARALRALALWARRYSPLTATDGADGLKIEIAGSAHLFGVEAGLLLDLSARLTALGFEHRLGLADTRRAAAALARAAAGPSAPAVAAPGRTAAALSPLPIEALGLDADAVRRLKRLGVKTIAALIGLPRASLARRFPGANGLPGALEALDLALGARGEPFDPIAPAPDRSVRAALAEPALTPEAIRAGLERLLPKLAAVLEADGVGARRAAFQIIRVDGSAARIEVGSAQALRAPAQFLALFSEKLDRLDPGFGVEAFLLEAASVEPFAPAPRTLSHALTGYDPQAADALVDRLAARLGGAAVGRLAAQDRWRPEHVEALVPATAATGARWSPPPGPERPARLLAQPEPVEAIAELPDGPPARFVWRRSAHRVTRAQGPERIGPEWWSDPEGRERTRDYYAVEDEAGRRFWLFREGLYEDAEPGRPPAWFLHGLAS